MTAYVSSLLMIAGLYLIAVASPGPNFFVIGQLSLSGQRQAALAAACGISLGSIIWVLLAMAGVAAVLASAEWLHLALRITGAAYLIWLGAKMLHAAARPKAQIAYDVAALEPMRAFRKGVLTSLTNPKSGVFWTSAFATTFPLNAPTWMFAATALMIAALSLGWHVGLAVAFTNKGVQGGYRRLRRAIDAACGVVLVGFGVLLAKR